MKEPKFTKEDIRTQIIAFSIVAIIICAMAYVDHTNKKSREDMIKRQQLEIAMEKKRLQQIETEANRLRPDSAYMENHSASEQTSSVNASTSKASDPDRYQDDLDYYLDDPEDIITYPEEIFDFNDD